MQMPTIVRPVFQTGERLTARRLNDAVEFSHSSLRRILLAPLSPGVAIGLQLTGAHLATGVARGGGATLSAFFSAEASATATTVTVTPGVAIDGVGRILVASQPLTFTAADIAAQVPDAAQGVLIGVAIAAGLGETTLPDPCATQGPNVVESVRLVFQKLPPLERGNFLNLLFDEGTAPSVNPWADPIDQPGSAVVYSVPLGSVLYGPNGALQPSMLQRAGVVPSFGGLRNSFGDEVMRLVRTTGQGTPAIGVSAVTVFLPTAPAFFTTIAGGPQVQSAYVATNIGEAPVARPSPSNPAVLEAAGGRNARPAISGATAIAMLYDGSANTQFKNGVPHSGFPLQLSLLSNDPKAPDPKVAPPDFSRAFVGPSPFVGISAGPSYSSGDDVIVPVATSGLVQAWVDIAPSASGAAAATVPVGTELAASGKPSQSQWPLTPVGAAPAVVVAWTALPLAPPTPAGPQLTWVWVVTPYLHSGSSFNPG
jgi:hypothetical protein